MGSYDNVLVSFNHDKIKIGFFFFNFPTFLFQHDPENNKACVPGGEDGNYIMFARATSGDKINNRKFSPCSLKSIKPVLLSKAIGELTILAISRKKGTEQKNS